MIKPGDLVKIGEYHIGLVIKPAPPVNITDYADINWWYVLINGQEEPVACLESALKVYVCSQEC